MHTKINRTLATIALVLGIILMAAATVALAFTIYLGGSVMQGLSGSSEVVDAPAVTEVPELPSSGETQSDWYVNDLGESCYEIAETNETICESPIPE